MNRYGIPFNNWMEAPVWVLRLQEIFDAAMRDISDYKQTRSIGYGGAYNKNRR